jgi:type IV secretion system protein VirB10
VSDRSATAVDEPFAEHDPRPVVALPRQGLPGAMIAAVAAVLALLLFLLLDAQRRAGPDTARASRAQVNAFSPPPPLAVPAEPVPEHAPLFVAPRPPVITTIASPAPRAPAPQLFAPAPPMQVIAPVSPQSIVAEPSPAERPRRRDGAPALVIDGGVEQGGSAGTAPTTATSPAAGSPAAGRGQQGLAADDTPARATLIGNKATTMATGTLIPAVLETPIDTARPGLVRAVVSEDARGFDASRVLVPRGSRLIGEYQADVRSGQDRVLVTWVRLIRPDGATIRLGSPASDPMGGAGVPGRVNTFFLQRFASAVLQSALTVGVNLASRPRNGSVIVGLPTGQIGDAVGQGLLPASDLRPKITVRQGAALNVFVARDLDFAGVPSRP